MKLCPTMRPKSFQQQTLAWTLQHRHLVAKKYLTAKRISQSQRELPLPKNTGALRSGWMWWATQLPSIPNLPLPPYHHHSQMQRRQCPTQTPSLSRTVQHPPAQSSQDHLTSPTQRSNPNQYPMRLTKIDLTKGTTPNFPTKPVLVAYTRFHRRRRRRSPLLIYKSRYRFPGTQSLACSTPITYHRKPPPQPPLLPPSSSLLHFHLLSPNSPTPKPKTLTTTLPNQTLVQHTNQSINQAPQPSPQLSPLSSSPAKISSSALRSTSHHRNPAFLQTLMVGCTTPPLRPALPFTPSANTHLRSRESLCELRQWAAPPRPCPRWWWRWSSRSRSLSSGWLWRTTSPLRCEALCSPLSALFSLPASPLPLLCLQRATVMGSHHPYPSLHPEKEILSTRLWQSNFQSLRFL